MYTLCFKNTQGDEEKLCSGSGGINANDSIVKAYGLGLNDQVQNRLVMLAATTF